MLHDIAPKQYHVEFSHREPGESARCLVYRGPEILEKQEGDWLTPPVFGEIRGLVSRSVYLFRIDEEEYYLSELQGEEVPEGCEFRLVRNAPDRKEQDVYFAEYTGYHLYQWYRNNQFCGRCGTPTRHDDKERMLRCPDCGNMIFPKIAPAIMVAVVHGDKILATRYRGRAYKGYAMIAGFNEIGETAEDTVRREVMEEVGLKVKDIRYFTSQPWGIDGNLMLGYFATLDGDDQIHLDQQELAQAVWLDRSELEEQTVRYRFSLAGELMEAFRTGEYLKY